MKKKLLALLLGLTLCLSLAACGSDAAETVTLTVAASPTPHAEILNQCVPILAEQGIELVVNEYSDYVVPNTAVAARMVSQSERRDVAALSSRFCGKTYGLELLRANVQNRDNNYTRFICISKEPVIYPGANRISLVIAFENKPGALYEILSKLAALDINMTKLESCPVVGSDFDFVFFLELDASVQDPSVLAMLEEMERSCAKFQFLGNYAEV